MNKKLYLFGLAVLATALSACGNGQDAGQSGAPAGQAPAAEIETRDAGSSPDIPPQGGGVIVIGDTRYEVVADWSCNWYPNVDILGATGHVVDDESIEFAFDLTLQSSGDIAGQITMRLTDEDVRWETADAGGDPLASGITEATLEEDGAHGSATFRQRGSGEFADDSSEFVEGSFDIRCPTE